MFKIEDFCNKLNINNEYTINMGDGSIIDILKYVSNKTKRFKYIKGGASENSFVISNTSSFGIAISLESNISTKQISVYVEINNIDENYSKLTLRTKLRIEVIVLTMITIPLYGILLYNIGSFPNWLFVLPLVVLIWFFIIYRFQENALIEEIEKVLKIKQDIK